MNKLALLILLALAIAISSCTGHTPSTTTTTLAAGNWEAELTGGTGPVSGLSFVTAFDVRDVSGNNESLNITQFGFFNAQSCFATGLDNDTVAGTASFNTNTGTNQVTGTLSYTVQSIAIGNVAAGNTLALNGTLNGTSTGTTTTTGNLTDGVVWGTWTLTGPCVGSAATVSGNFIMCQGTSTCTIP
jgi:hypothetical protein